jgi:ribosomal protein S18 acetylase RimI-like enzyme
MLCGVSLLSTLEAYYDAALRPLATTEQVGPFTLFLRDDEEGWPFYARPSLGHDATFTHGDVAAVRARQRELGEPESLEWVHENSPTLLSAAREAGLRIRECPLLVLPGGADAVVPPLPEGCAVTMVDADSPQLAASAGAVEAGFSDRDEVVVHAPGRRSELVRSGLLAVAAAYDGQGCVGGGSHSPRGAVSELTGIAVVPRARRQGVGAAITAALVADARERGAATVFLSAQDDTVARVYERIGFQRVGTACVAEPA